MIVQVLEEVVDDPRPPANTVDVAEGIACSLLWQRWD